MNYTHRFQETLATDGFTAEALLRSSVSEQDCEMRVQELEKTFSNLDEYRDDFYSAGPNPGNPGHPGFSDGRLHGIDFFDASISAAIKSYANLFCVEKNMNQPDASLPYFNIYGVKSAQIITPNIGKSRVFTEAEGDFTFAGVFKKADAKDLFKFGPKEAGDYRLNAIPIVHTRVLITFKELGGENDGRIWSINDNGFGGLIAEPKFVEEGKIDYGHADNVPAIEFKVNTNLIKANDVEIKVTYVEDTPKEQLERLKPEVGYYNASSAPIIVPYEVNQLTTMAVKKSLGMDMVSFTLRAVTDEYTKIINQKVAAGIMATAANRQERLIDLSGYGLAAGNNKSLVESFLNQLKGLDTAMAQKNEKVVYVSAFLTSVALGDLFYMFENTTPKWEANKAITYIDDVCGYLDGIPVVRTKHINDETKTLLQGYATHKVKEGQLAPLMRGMFLPLTTMNEVGSFDNPLLKTGGIFSYEGVSPLTNELTIGYQVKVNQSGTMMIH